MNKLMKRQRDDSLRFYKYLCQKIGFEEDVKVRRITSNVCDIANGRFKQIRSGSNGEGLHLKGSDLDLMRIDTRFKVLENKNDTPVQRRFKIPLFMDIEDTQPCFTKLRIECDRTSPFFVKKVLYDDHKGIVLSSKMFKQIQLDTYTGTKKLPTITKIHGPCCADEFDLFDIATCLKCDKWISHAEPWIQRSRQQWPSADLISKIISCGVLFVPIGNKGSINELIEWRLSFSVAEKFLVFSFNHTQFLCYALLKIFLKEIVDNEKCLKGLLCSYFIKTLMFWILEESDPAIWIPDNIIPCFQACLHRLLYCVDYKILLHYFIPENNLFYLRFNAINRKKMCNLLKMSYEQGIQFVFATKTLMDYPKHPGKINQPLCRNARLVNEINHTLSCGIYVVEENMYMLLSTLLHYSRSRMSADIFQFFLSRAHQNVPHTFQILEGSNKEKYPKLKNIISHLLIGIQSDAVSGWMLLASFFYETKNYRASLFVLNHGLLKCTDEKVKLGSSLFQSSLNFNQIHALNMVKSETLMTSLKTLTMNHIFFPVRSLIIPIELQLEVHEQIYLIDPKPFAHFLSFLCCYHLKKDAASCNHFIRQLIYDAEHIFYSNQESYPVCKCHILICIGIAMQMFGETSRAKEWLRMASVVDGYNLTSAKIRLSDINLHT